MRILFVCLGNICRSPTAEAATRAALAEAGLADRVEVDSAGTGDWHLGEPPDRRMCAAADREGLTLDGAARRFTVDDFDRFDLICVMDRANFRDVTALARDEGDREKVRMFREFDPDAGDDEVPDPYFGGDEGFRQVLAISRAAARGLVDHASARIG